MIGRAKAALALSLSVVGTPAFATCQVSQYLEMKVTMQGSRPMVDAKINGKDARFVVDSGAFFSTVSEPIAKEYGLRAGTSPQNFTLQGIGGRQAARVARANSFTLQGLDIPNLDFVVGGTEIEAAGLLGQNFLGIADVEYDLGHGVIRFMRSKDCKDVSLAYWASGKPVSIMGISDKADVGYHTVGRITVNGTKLQAVFDTGAASSILTLAAAKRAGIDVYGPGATSAGYVGGVGRNRVRSWIVPVASFALEGEEVKGSRLRVGDFDFPHGDMLLGIDFFLSHRIYVSNSMRKLFFTYEGGPIFNLRPTRVLDAAGVARELPVGAAADDPKSADEFARRGAAFASRAEYAKAIGDLTRAIELSPQEPRYYLQRAEARLRTRQPSLAGADLDKAIALAPGDVDARLLRAQLRTGRRDKAAALDDLDAVDKTIAPTSGVRLTLGALYGANDAFDRGIAQYDRWIAAHPDDGRRSTALNGRCWARALSGKDLDRALSDCNAALRLQPGSATFLDSRGLVKLRRGDVAGAAADYDAALARQPKMAWSLYGRGLARAKQGLAKESAADRAAALAIEPDLAERARGLGITG